MKPSVKIRLDNTNNRYEEIKQLLSDPDVTDDLNRYRDLTKEYAQLEPLVEKYHHYLALALQLEEAKLLLEESDPELQQLAKQESKDITDQLEKIDSEFLIALLPKDPHDDNNIF